MLSSMSRVSMGVARTNKSKNTMTAGTVDARPVGAFALRSISMQPMERNDLSDSRMVCCVCSSEAVNTWLDTIRDTMARTRVCRLLECASSVLRYAVSLAVFDRKASANRAGRRSHVALSSGSTTPASAIFSAWSATPMGRPAVSASASRDSSSGTMNTLRLYSSNAMLMVSLINGVRADTTRLSASCMFSRKVRQFPMVMARPTNGSRSRTFFRNTSLTASVWKALVSSSRGCRFAVMMSLMACVCFAITVNRARSISFTPHGPIRRAREVMDTGSVYSSVLKGKFGRDTNAFRLSDTQMAPG
mmetsp:Transcript_22496/g.56420  ORF Transcript_22496/g.56420 Transcript_22496/m.56420 type:complete len:304 (+) Transcript_22496:226-1137(+)